jgi:hypothetical protein
MGRVYTTARRWTAAVALPLALCAAAAPGCFAFPRTRPEGEVATAGARPDGCALEYLEKEPQRAFEELGELTDLVANPDPFNPALALRDRACRLGADALVITRRVVADAYGRTLLSARAIRWRPEAKAADL